MVYRASRETHSISAIRFASTCFPSKDPTPAPRGSPRVPQGLPHRLRALQDTPLANNPPGPRTTGSRANRMSWRLPATVVLLLYLSLNSLSPHPVFSRLTNRYLASLATLATLPTHEHTHRCNVKFGSTGAYCWSLWRPAAVAIKVQSVSKCGQ